MSIHFGQNLGTLKRLKILSLQSNRITKMEGLEGLESLEELYLSHNGVSKIEGLESNVRLGHRQQRQLHLDVLADQVEDPGCRE
jgi:Leucine-rich repeat (LRR) protein